LEKKLFSRILYSVILLASFPVEAHFSLGAYLDSPGRIQVDDSGKTNKTDITPFIAANIYLHIYESFWFQPEIGYIFSQTSEGETKNRKFYNLYYAAYQVIEPLFLKLGFGFFITEIETPSGEVSLNNGDSYTTFYRPGGKSRSYNSTLSFGAEYFFSKHMSARFDSHIFAIRNSDARSLSFNLGATYHF